MNAEAYMRIAEEKKKRTGILNLSYCDLTEIPADLKEMNWLINLTITNNWQVTEITNLENLTNLQSLYLNENEITEIKNLENLTNLQELYLPENRLTEIKNLENLENLEVLDLRSNRLTKIKNVENLINLKTLWLPTNSLTEIKNLETLTNLQKLSLGSNRITKIKNLESLAKLQSLDLSGNQLTKIENLESLAYLQELYIYNNKLTKIENLEGLINLQSLHLYGSPITEVSYLKSLVNSPALKKLYLYGIRKNDLHIPAENFGKSETDNCLRLLKGYFESIKKGSTTSREVPVILVGNSTAGKTSLLHFLKEKEFPPPQDHSTHGIEPDLWQPPHEVLEAFENMAGLEGVQFYFWDFGGQEYYHATHRLFFSKDAVYVLVWDKDTNKQGVEKIPVRLLRPDGIVEETEQPVDLFPYTYWLDTIRFFAPDQHTAPIIIVQNKLDKPGNAKERPADYLFERFGICQDVFHLSVEQANATQPKGKPYKNFEDFVEYLLTIVKEHVTKMARGARYHDIRNLLKQNREDKIWRLPELLQYVREHWEDDYPEGDLISNLYSLCANRFVFYYPDVEELKNCIFLNPAFVTEIIYDILDDEVRKSGGEFGREQVNAKAGKEDGAAFVALMKKFELIFENPESGKLIAPQYLPGQLKNVGEWNKLKLRFKEFAVPDYYIRFPDFMPRSIMLRFLAVYGDKAVGQNYWKNGMAFMLEGKEAVVLYDADSTGFKIFVEDGDKYVQRLILDTLLKLTNNNETLQIGLNLSAFVQYSELRADAVKYPDVKALSGNRVASAGLRHFVEPIDNIKQKAPLSRKQPIKVFVSYSHKDADYFKTFVGEFGEYTGNSKKYSFNTFDDRQLILGGDWNDKLEEEVAACDVGILLFSAAFLNSDYINEKELGPILEKLENKKGFVICPIYFRPFEFAEFEFLKKYQFFKPDGAKYGQADKGTNLCFAHLVKFNPINGVNIPTPNSNRDEYLRDLSKALFKALDEKFQN